MTSMDVLPVIASFAASILAFFSGFGLGSVLLPVFALFYPVEVALLMTAIVHLSNNLFKWLLMGKHAVQGIVLNFGLPAVLGAIIGAASLVWINKIPEIFEWHAFGQSYHISMTGLIVGILLVVFSVKTLVMKVVTKKLDLNNMRLGGLLSGFFGGISGHQGAIRNAYLVQTGIDKFAIIGTSVWIACFIDIGRIAVYTQTQFVSVQLQQLYLPILAAFSGAVLGKRLLRKMSLKILQMLMAIFIGLAGVAIALGIL